MAGKCLPDPPRTEVQRRNRSPSELRCWGDISSQVAIDENDLAAIVLPRQKRIRITDFFEHCPHGFPWHTRAHRGNGTPI